MYTGEGVGYNGFSSIVARLNHVGVWVKRSMRATEVSVKSLYAWLIAVALILGGGSVARGASVGFSLPVLGIPSIPVYGFAERSAAAPVATGYTLRIYSDSNKPLLKFTNDSESASITEFIVTIGDTDYNFDYGLMQLSGTSGGMNWKRVVPDANDTGGERADQVQYHNFTGFTPGKTFTFKTDVDPDHFDRTEDYRKVMFNNGDAPNATVTVFFSNGITLSRALPDGSKRDSYSFTDAQVVPLPPAAWGAMALFALLACMRRRQA